MSDQKQEMIDMIRRLVPHAVANDLASVQPMDEAGKAFGELYELLKNNPDKVLLVITKKDENE